MGDVVEAVARGLWFDFVDQRGYPNGLPTWGEMTAWPESDRNNRCDEFRSLARAALLALAENVSEGMVEAGAEAFLLAAMGSGNKPNARDRRCTRAALQAALTEAVGDGEKVGG